MPETNNKSAKKSNGKTALYITVAVLLLITLLTGLSFLFTGKSDLPGKDGTTGKQTTIGSAGYTLPSSEQELPPDFFD